MHGGPEAHYPNYRGSTGRGVEFSKTSQAAAAGPEFDDLVDGVDHLIRIGLVDREKVGITGGSYGGYRGAPSSGALCCSGVSSMIRAGRPAVA